jgi:uncharacterized protein YecE (DUF72 family)
MLEPGLFYPAEAKTPEDRLRFYADEFPIVEVDATYYALPSERNSRAWADRTPAGFIFNVKAFSVLTQHPTRPESLPKELRAALPEGKKNVYPRDMPSEVIEECWDRFCGALKPLADAGRMSAVLFQFPEWFLPGRASRDYILECKDRLGSRLPDVWCAIEFRNARWMSDAERQVRTLEFLESNELPYVCVDMPQGFTSSIPPVARTTAPLALVRFHGRRDETWSKRGIGPSERFRYDYSARELQEWTPRIRELADEAREVHVLMNNCYSDYAVRAARSMAQLLLDDSE